MRQLPARPGATYTRRATLRTCAGLAGLALGHRLGLASARSRRRALAPGDMNETLREIVTQKLDELLIPGAVVLVETPHLRFFDAFGSRRVDRDDPVTTGDHFRIASNTKTMTGTVVLQLVTEGLLSLDDPVSAYRPDAPNGDQILIRHILDMTSGLYNYSEYEPFNQVMDDDPTRAWNPDELLDIAFAEPPYFAPGEGYHYANTNTVFAGVIAEQVTGRPLNELLDERIFTPLELADTSFPVIEVNAIPDPHPTGYQYGTNVSTLVTPALPADEIAAAQAGTLLPNDVGALNPSWAWAAGAAISTATDLAAYVKALATGQLLDTAMQRQRIESVAPAGEPSNQPIYGLALVRFGALLGHTGSTPGYQSFMGYDPEADVTVVVLANLQLSPDGHETANAVAAALIAELYAG